MTAPGKPSICFVQINALGLLAPGTNTPFGGAEVRALTFARMLMDSGRFRVSFAVLNEPDQPFPETSKEGLGLFQLPRHAFHSLQANPDITGLYASFQADCFVSLGANEVSYEMVRQAQHLRLPTVVGLASDQSLRDSVFNGSMILNEYLVPEFHAWEALHRATEVLAQTQWQKDRVYRQVGRIATLVPNPIPAGWEQEQGTPAGHADCAFDFLWVGRPLPDKNPDILFELARDMEHATFRMVCNGGLQALPEPWRSNLPPNVILSDRLDSQEELRSLMVSSRAMVNTSPLEGFPNLMLQGAMVGCPTLFLSADPDGWSADHGCAASAHGDVEGFLALLNRARRDSAWLDGLASRAFQRARTCHSPQAVQQVLVATMDRVLAEAGKAER